MMRTWFSATLAFRPTSKTPKRKNAHSQLLGRIRFLLNEVRANGRTGGRRKKLKPQQEKEIAVIVLQDNSPAAQVARLFNVHPATVGRTVARHKYKSNLQSKPE